MPEKKKNAKKPKPVEFSLDPDGELDEVWFRNADVHIERMSRTGFWIGFDLPDGSRFMANTGVCRGRWFFTIEEGTEGGRFFRAEHPRRPARKTAPDPAAGTSKPRT